MEKEVLVIDPGRTEIKHSDIANAVEIVIPEGVTDIVNSAFDGCRSLKEITIPEGVKKIGVYAFRECERLTSVTLPSSLTSIGYGAFCNTGLTSITIPEGVTDIGISAFHECERLTSVTLPSSLTYIEESAFGGCRSLKEITIPEGITEISYRAFGGCERLTSVTLPSSLTRIGWEAFCDTGLTSITIPEGVTRIEDSAFAYTDLTSITIPEGVTHVGNGAFDECERLTSVTLPSSLTYIGYSAFGGCRSLKEITIPKGVKSIEAYTFTGCRSLKKVIIPEGVTKIGDDVFHECERLTSVTLPSSIRYYEKNAFAGLKSLEKLSINYTDFKSLSKSISALLQTEHQIDGTFLKVFRCSKYKYEGYSIDIFLIGKKLTPFQEKRIEKKLKKVFKKANIRFEEKVEQEKQEKHDYYDEEINNLIIKIKETCEELPAEARKIAEEKLSALSENYKQGLKKEEELFAPKISIFTVAEDFNKDKLIYYSGKARNDYFVGLNDLNDNIGFARSSIELLKEIKESKELIKNRDFNLEESNKKIIHTTKSILYLIDSVDEESRKEILGVLENLLNTAEKECNENVMNYFSDSVELSKPFQEIKINLRISLEDLLDKARLKRDRIGSYIKLITYLDKDAETNDKDKNSIYSLIYDINTCIEKIDKSEIREETRDKFNDICNKFIIKAKSEIKDKKYSEKSNFENLEQELRQEIYGFLVEFRLVLSYSPVSNFKTTNEKQLLIDTLKKALSGVKNGTILDDTYEERIPIPEIRAIYSFIKNIYIEKEKIAQEKKEILNNEFFPTLESWINILEKWEDLSYKNQEVKKFETDDFGTEKKLLEANINKENLTEANDIINKFSETGEKPKNIKKIEREMMDILAEILLNITNINNYYKPEL